MKRTKKSYANTNTKSKSKKVKKVKKVKKGGMFRQSASKAAKTVFGKVFGETWPDRLSKGKDMIDAGLKGAADAAKKKGSRAPSSASSKSFAVDSPRSHISYIESPVKPTARPPFDELYRTPKKSTSTREPILLQTRLKNDETADQRARRLGLSVAPTLQHPIPIVAKLFHDE